MQFQSKDAVNMVLRKFYYRPSKILQFFFNAISDWGLLSQYIRGGIKFTQYLFFKKRKVDNLIKK